MTIQRRLLAIGLVFFGDLVYAIPSPEEVPSTVINSEVTNSSVAGDELLLQALSLIGIAYKFGGSTPLRGLDCSGFIQYIFKQSLRLNMPRTAAEQAHIGIPIKQQELQAGDLVFFNIRGRANSHVGLYLGEDKFIHAPRTGKQIEIGSLKSSYWAKRYNGARRVIYDKATLNIITTDSVNEKQVVTKPSSQSNMKKNKPKKH